MPIDTTCPNCSAAFRTKDEYAGKRVKCPKCGEPMTIPGIADTVKMPPPLATARPVVASKPRPADEQPEERSSRRRQEATGGRDEASTRSSRGKEEESESPRSGRRRVEEEEPKKRKGSPLPLILGIVGGIVLLCCGGPVGVWLFWIKPAGEKFVKEVEAEASRLKQQQGMSNGGEFKNKFEQVSVGMSKKQVDDLLGLSSVKPQDHDVLRATMWVADGAAGKDRWQAKNKLGHVLMWNQSGETVLVAFSDNPVGGGMVVGTVGDFGLNTIEPIKLPAEGSKPPVKKADDKTPVASLTVDELYTRSAEFKDKWVTVRGQYKSVIGGNTGAFEMLSEQGQRMVVSPSFETKGFAWKDPPQPLDSVEVTGKVGGNASRPSVYDSVLVKLTPNTEPVATVTAEELTAEFEKNADAASAKYKGKLLKVSGTVSSGGNVGNKLGLRGITARPPGGKIKGYFIDAQFDGEFRTAAAQVKLSGPATILGRFQSFDMTGFNQSGTVTLLYCRVVK